MMDEKRVIFRKYLVLKLSGNTPGKRLLATLVSLIEENIRALSNDNVSTEVLDTLEQNSLKLEMSAELYDIQRRRARIFKEPFYSLNIKLLPFLTLRYGRC